MWHIGGDSTGGTVQLREGESGPSQQELQYPAGGAYIMDQQIAGRPFQHQVPTIGARRVVLVASCYQMRGVRQPSMQQVADRLRAAVLPHPPPPLPTSAELPEFEGTQLVDSSESASVLGRYGAMIAGFGSGNETDAQLAARFGSGNETDAQLAARIGSGN